jgi:hypothetical protein
MFSASLPAVPFLAMADDHIRAAARRNRRRRADTILGMKPFAALTVATVSLQLLGCGRIFYLPGHNNDNDAAPPDVTMRVGERRLVLLNGLNPLAMPPAMMRTEDPKVVAVDTPDQDSAYLVAVSVGSARVHYEPPDGKGFVVHVVAAR